jgi:uncharacterized protein YjlB
VVTVLFEQVTVGIRDVVRVAISGASTQIGGVSNPLVSIRDSSAELLILPEGIAGQIKVRGSPFNIPGLEFLVDEGYSSGQHTSICSNHGDDFLLQGMQDSPCRKDHLFVLKLSMLLLNLWVF